MYTGDNNNADCHNNSDNNRNNNDDDDDNNVEVCAFLTHVGRGSCRKRQTVSLPFRNALKAYWQTGQHAGSTALDHPFACLYSGFATNRTWFFNK